jgi:DNA polymerase-3 subunit alpha/error-prone DNA polymerase
VSFQAAYLKAHFPAQFMAAVISNQGGFYSTSAYVSEARRLGLTILPPDVNESAMAWTGQGRNLRVGLMAIKGLGQATMARIMDERASGGPYAGLEDLCARVAPADDEARALIQAGALDAAQAHADRAELIWRLAGQRRAREAAAGPGRGLFARPAPPAPPLPQGDPLEGLRRQYAVLGFLVEHHPIVLFEQALAGRGLIKARELAAHGGRRVRLAGWLITAKTVWSKRDEPMQFVSFEDDTGLVEATFFPNAYRRFAMSLDWGRPYLLSGLVEENFGAVTLTVENARRL